VRRAGIEWNAVPVRAPPCGGGGPSRCRGTGAGHGQVWQPGSGDHADEWGACQYGRPRVQELDGGHNAGWRGGGVRARYAGRRHQVEWRGFVDGAGEGGPSVAPRSRRDPDPGVLGGGESSDTIAVAASPVQFNGGVCVGFPLVEYGDAVGRRGCGRARHGGGARAAAGQAAGDSTGGGSGGRSGTRR